MGSILGSGRSPEVGNGNPLQCSCLGIFMIRRAWWATVHWVTKSQTQLNTWHAMMSSVYNSNNWTSYIDFWFWRFFFLTFLSLFPFALNILKRDCALSFKFWNLFFFFWPGGIIQFISECTLLFIWLSFFHNFVFLVFGYNIFCLGTLKLYLKFSSASWKLFV